MTPYEKKRDIIFAVATSVFSGLLLALAFSYPPASSGFPKFLLGLMLLLSLLLLAKSFRARAAAVPEKDKSDAAALRKNMKTALAVIGSTAAYALAVRHIGYFSATTAFLLGVMVLYGKNKLLSAMTASVAFMAVMYALFVWFLGMRLPEGLLF